MQKGMSRPKNQNLFLLLEGISPSAVEVLQSAGYDNVEVVAKALDQAALIAALKNVQILGIRSRTQVTEAVIAAAPSVVALGCFSVGTNQVDLEATRRRGVPVFNAPFSNTRSVAALTIAEIVMLLRGAFAQSKAAHHGRRNKRPAGRPTVGGKNPRISGEGKNSSQDRQAKC